VRKAGNHGLDGLQDCTDGMEGYKRTEVGVIADHGLDGLQDFTDGMEGYKRTEVGVIPVDWEVKKLGELFKFKNGVNAEKKHYGKGIKFINILEVIQNNSLFYEDIPGFITLDAGTMKSNIVQKGDVLFNRTSETQEEIGLTAVYLDDKEVVFGGFVIRARPISDLINYYFSKYGFSSKSVRNQIIKKGQGAVRANIGQSDLKEVFISLPPLHEQKTIALALSDTDALIAACDRAITKKRNIKQGAMQQLLTGKVRLPGFSGEWEVKKLGDISFVNQGLQIAIEKRLKNPLPNSKKYITIQFLNNAKEIEYINEYSSSVCCNEDDILMTRTGNTGIVVSNVSGVFHNNFFKINFDRKILDKNYLIGYLNLDKIQNLILAKAGTSTIPDLNHNDFYSIPVSFPPLPEQKAIAQILSDMDAEIAALEKKRDKYKAIKQGMMQELLTGKTRLNTD